MSKMGRPQLPSKERRSKVVVIRLRGDEHRSLKAAAKAAGVPVTEYVRSILFQDEETQR